MCGEDLVWDSTSSMLLISEWASPATDHETFLMIVDGAWRLDSQEVASAAAWVVYDSVGIRQGHGVKQFSCSSPLAAEFTASLEGLMLEIFKILIVLIFLDFGFFVKLPCSFIMLIFCTWAFVPY